MAIDFNELEKALYHIRVNYFLCDTDNLRIQLSARADGDTVIDVWNERNRRVGNFFLSTIIEEIELLQQGSLDLCDLSANNIEDEEEDWG